MQGEGLGGAEKRGIGLGGAGERIESEKRFGTQGRRQGKGGGVWKEGGLSWEDLERDEKGRGSWERAGSDNIMDNEEQETDEESWAGSDGLV